MLELVGTLAHKEGVDDVVVMKVDNFLSSYASGIPPMIRMDGGLLVADITEETTYESRRCGRILDCVVVHKFSSNMSPPHAP